MNALQPLKFHRILVPVDESRPSQNSLAVAAGIARESGATVVLAHVAEMSYSEDKEEMLAAYGEHIVEVKLVVALRVGAAIYIYWMIQFRIISEQFCLHLIRPRVERGTAFAEAADPGGDNHIAFNGMYHLENIAGIIVAIL